MNFSEEPIIEFHHFGFQYNAQAKPTLYDIDLAVHKGEKVLILGPSGCGKSTLVHCINGLIPFSWKGTMTGSLKVKGRETKDLSLFELSSVVGTVLQDTDGQFVGLTVAEDLAFALENDCVPLDELKARVEKAARLVHIENHLSHAPQDLSGGQKQRVSMGGVMVSDVEVLLFDEPLANLDPKTGKTSVELIDELAKKTGAAVVIIEHRLEDVLWRAVDKVVLMDGGRIIFTGTPDELLSTDLLIKDGIREPLYVTALKYAGVKIRPEMHPWSIREIALSEEEKTRVRKWFGEREKKTPEKDRESLLSVRNLSFSYRYGEEILHDISLDVKRGEMLAIVGTNGAGKSTFAKCVCGFEKPEKGSLVFENEDLSLLSIKERADRIGYVMQNPNQMISRTFILEEVGLGLVSRKAPEETVKERSEKALRICGLWPQRNWPVSALSFGQKKRLTIAAILSLDPEMIILDEPTAGQDYRHYTEIMEFLLELKSRGITIVMITHDMHLMLEYAERTVVFSDGRIIADDTGANVLTSPDIVEEASLKETSLYDLAVLCGIDEPGLFVQCFIDYEREVVRREEELS